MSEAMNEFPLLNACKDVTSFLSVTKSQPDAIAAEIDMLIARYKTGINVLHQAQRECDLRTELNKQLEENKQQMQENKLLLTQRLSHLETENNDLRARLSAPSNLQDTLPANDQTPCQITANNVVGKASALVSVSRSPPHPDPGPFTGEKRELLPSFIKQLKLKLRQKEDRWPTEQNRMGYILSQLSGPALTQFDDQNEDGLINFSGVVTMIDHLRIAFGVLDDREASQKRLRALKQGQKTLADFLPESVSTARKTGFNDVALISALKLALHKSIVVRLSFTPSSQIPVALDGFLNLVRQTDGILSQLDTNYTRTLPVETPVLTTTEGGDAMDLSLLWTAADSLDGRRPKNAMEREARRKYNQIHNLCQWCSSRNHAAQVCTSAPWNKNKPVEENKQVSGKV